MRTRSLAVLSLMPDASPFSSFFKQSSILVPFVAAIQFQSRDVGLIQSVMSIRRRMQSRSHHAQVSLVYAYVDYSSPGIEAFAARMGLLYGGVDFFAWRHCMETLALCRAGHVCPPDQNWVRCLIAHRTSRTFLLDVDCPMPGSGLSPRSA
jgi:hypothetical protein